jgi:hypothetical protein
VAATTATTLTRTIILTSYRIELTTLDNNATLGLETKTLESLLDRLCRHLLHVTTTTNGGGVTRS